MLKEIECLVCGRKMEVDERTRFGMCWRCVLYNKFTEYEIKKEEIKQIKRRRKNATNQNT